MNALFQLQSLPLAELPDEALRAIYDGVKGEMAKRKRLAKSIASSERFYLGPKKHTELVAFEELLKEDWSHLFPDGDATEKYYVYAHVRPSGKRRLEYRYMGRILPFGLTSLPFYIGKGCGGRAFDLKRNEGHGAELRTLLGSGSKPDEIVKILAEGLTERKALELESKLICFFGTRFEMRPSGVLVNLDIPPRPTTRRYF